MSNHPKQMRVHGLEATMAFSRSRRKEEVKYDSRTFQRNRSMPSHQRRRQPEAPTGRSVGEMVDANRHREDERVILAWADRHTITLSDPEPALGDVGDRDAIPGDLVLVVEDVALRLHRAPAGQVNGEPVPEGVDDGLPDGGHPLVPAFDRH